jgi:hypothetical protein
MLGICVNFRKMDRIKATKVGLRLRYCECPSALVTSFNSLSVPSHTNCRYTDRQTDEQSDKNCNHREEFMAGSSRRLVKGHVLDTS